jgi:hypothetical protein
MFLVREAPATLTPLVVRMTMVLGRVLLTTVLLLRKLATLLGITVVRASRFHVHHLQIGQTRPQSSSLGNIRARVPRTIVLRSNQRRHRIIVRRKLRRQDPSSRRVRQTRVSSLLRNRTGQRLRHGLKTSSATIRLRKRAQHSRLHNARTVRRRHRSVTRVRRLRRNVRIALLSRLLSVSLVRRRLRNATITRLRLLRRRTKTSSPQPTAKHVLRTYRPAAKNDWPFPLAAISLIRCSPVFALK